MEKLIREGTLRIQMSESSCDVILVCRDKKLKAHKLILSIASPLFRDLLNSRSTETAVLIFPDVHEKSMSLILDYIYTGHVSLCSETFNDFISVAQLLQLPIDETYSQKSKYTSLESDKILFPNASKDMKNENHKRKSRKKLPNLLPIGEDLIRRLPRKSLNYHVLPNPWKPRISTVLEDPKKDYPLMNIDNQYLSYRNDSNNNFNPEIVDEPNFYPTKTTEQCPLDCQNPTEAISSEKKLKPEEILFPENRKHNEVSNNMWSEEKYYSTDSNHSYSSIRHKSNQFDKIDFHSSSPTKEENISEEKSNLFEYTKIETIDSEEGTRSSDHEKNKPYSCDDCGKTFSQLRNYKYHRSVHEGTKEFAAKCQECGKVFNDRGYLSSHMKIHRDKKEYACSYCPKRFNQRVAFNMHLRIHTGIKPHECQTCGKSFSRKMLLKQHQRVHTGERPYSCPECGKTFADRSNMSLHARLHTGVKPYACNLCSKSFTKKHHLKTHMNFHTGLKPYSCQKCGLSFSQSSNMRTHYKKCILKPSSTQRKTEDDIAEEEVHNTTTVKIDDNMLSVQ